MKNLILLVLSFCLGINVAYASRDKVIVGEATIECGENLSFAKAKEMAIERAKINALAIEYGTTVSAVVQSESDTRNGTTEINFSRVSRSEVLGEWLGDVGEPQITRSFDANGNMVVSVKIKGRTRAIGNAQVSLNAKVLRNGTTHQHESKEFRAGDDIYFCFEGNADGYLAVYLVDGVEAYCLLPYHNDHNGAVEVKDGRHYVFFSEEKAPQHLKAVTDTYEVTYEEGTKYQKIFVIYSSEPFRKAVAHMEAPENGKLRPAQLSAEDFDEWLLSVRSHDKSMRVESFHINVLPR